MKIAVYQSQVSATIDLDGAIDRICEQMEWCDSNHLCVGIMICRDSNYPELARSSVARGATAILVPSNNALPHARATPDTVAEARVADVARATENGVPVARADVVGQTEDLRGYGSSSITGPDGNLLSQAPDGFHGCLVAGFPPVSEHGAAAASDYMALTEHD